MRDVVILFLHLIVTVVRLARPGGLRSVVAESLLVKHQLRILNRGRKRAPTRALHAPAHFPLRGVVPFSRAYPHTPVRVDGRRKDDTTC